MGRLMGLVGVLGLVLCTQLGVGCGGFDAWFERASSSLATCSSRDISLSVGSGSFEILRVDTERECAVRALVRAGSTSGTHSARCTSR